MTWQHTYLTAKVFLRHYRHSPVQASAILVGIALAVTLLIGVKATNENAINSYSQATELLSQRASAHVSSNQSDTINQQVYFALSQAGIPSLGVLEGVAEGPSGHSIAISGNDLFAAMSLALTHSPPPDKKNPQSKLMPFSSDIPLQKLINGYPAILMSRSLADKLSPSGKVQLNGYQLEVIRVDDSAGLGNDIVADLSLLQPLLKQQGQLSYVALFPQYADQTKSQLIKAAKHALTAAGIAVSTLNFEADDNGASLGALTDSFHLNLKAMGMLAFLVGLFIAYNGVRYSLMKRHSLCIQLMQQGVGANHLMAALLLELIVLVIIGTIIGFIVGLQLSQWLQPMVSMTLEQLYGARLIPGNWQWQWFMQALALTLGAALFACLPMLLGLKRTPLAQGAYQRPRTQYYRKLHAKMLLTGFITLVISCTLMQFTEQYQYSLLLLGAVTIAIPLMLPQLLTWLIQLIEQSNPQGLLQYALAETRQIIAPLSLAMMAMLLAICANVSMNTLVGSFEITLKQWLESRLHAELYIKPSPQQIPQVQAYLQQDKNVTALYKQWRSDAVLTQRLVANTSINSDNSAHPQATFNQTQLHVPIALVSRDASSIEQTSSLKVHSIDFWQGFSQGSQVMISEPLAIKQQLNIGDKISVDRLNKPLTIGAVYYDYGNPTGEVLIGQRLWQASTLPATPISFAVNYQGELSQLQLQLKQHAGLNSSTMYSQKRIKQEAITIFTRTFSITLVLNSLTLIVAAIGLFSASTMLTQSRLAPFARLFAMGVSRGQLQFMALGQMLIMVLLTCLVAMPMGALLGYLVISKVTLQAFGWSIAMVWDWYSYAQVVLTAVLSCMLAVILPLYWQTRKPLISSLQQESQ
ncbi:FtsX-like permease family protein [Shewanella intestini]|uniref:FtsX-like permease family protein n=1 Tax=Shewanella intestini TaxID=2017544 RepID=A0ABS5I753_9GAMM|nr:MULTISPECIES: ABC transporter permease [Shewanella]MBR9729205.1 FtsX-like permease family protein [Shewanella intestini]MRG37224.1 FtsX-like permease family protein [Shewanella sp. XMDDZSB0408]